MVRSDGCLCAILGTKENFLPLLAVTHQQVQPPSGFGWRLLIFFPHPDQRLPEPPNVPLPPFGVMHPAETTHGAFVLPVHRLPGGEPFGVHLRTDERLFLAAGVPFGRDREVENFVVAAPENERLPGPFALVQPAVFLDPPDHPASPLQVEPVAGSDRSRVAFVAGPGGGDVVCHPWRCLVAMPVFGFCATCLPARLVGVNQNSASYRLIISRTFNRR